MSSKVNNFKIFRIFDEKSILIFCELCKGVYNTFMIKEYNTFMVKEELDDAAMAQIVPGTTKLLSAGSF